MTNMEDTRARMRWTSIVEPGDGDAGALIERLGAAEAWQVLASAEGPQALAHACGTDGEEKRRLAAAFARWQPRLGRIDLEAQRRRAATCGARFLTPVDPEWVGGWDDLGVHAPIGMWVRGDAGVLTQTSAIAVVGARAATGYGEHVTAEIVGDLAQYGPAIVSGAAYGIDGAAHRAALATGQLTAAVLAGGADRVYPAGHARFLAEVLQAGGAVLSEVPLGAEPTRWRFLARNRIIAATASATVVVEAGARSGSLNTAGHAASLGRALGAVPGPVTSAASAGCHRLLREYDAVCVTSGPDVAELAGLGDTQTGPVATGSAAGGDASRVFESLSRRSPRTADDIAARCGISVASVDAVLGLLALDGRATRSADGWLAQG